MDLKTIHEKEIAVVGVSERHDTFGYKIFRDLLKHGFKVSGVNLRGGRILGRKIHKSLHDLERVPDFVLTVVPGRVTERVVEECRMMGVREVWMQPGSESHEAIRTARHYGITVTAHRCFMVEVQLW